MEESLFCIDKKRKICFYIGRENDNEKIEGVQKLLNEVGEMDLEFCREGDFLLKDKFKSVHNVHDYYKGDISSNLIYADVLMYFEDSLNRLED